MKYNFPKIELSEPERFWLKEVAKYLGEDRVNEQAVWVSLFKSNTIPLTFRQYDIDRRLLENGYHITLLGLWHVDPTNELITYTENIILYIREIFLNGESRDRFFVDEIVTKLGLESKQINIIFKFLTQLHLVSALSRENNDYVVFTGGELLLKEYLAFDGIESYVKKMFHEEEIKRAKQEDERNRGYGNSVLNRESLIANTTYQPNTAFILMAIDETNLELEVVKDSIKDVCKAYDLQAVRVDEIEHQCQITEIILTKIRDSEVIFADLTNERPNVYYEVGYAHAINKRIILFRKKGAKVHFDLFGYKISEYITSKDLRDELTNRLENVLGRKHKQ